MKRLIILLLTFAALAIMAIFIFIPSKINISSVSMVRANNLAAHRILMDDATWVKWWPHEKAFHLKQTDYTLTRKMLTSFELSINDGKGPVISQLMIIPVNADSLRLAWSCAVEAGNNPLKRFSAYRRAKAIKKNIDFLLDSLSGFIADQRNIYGFEIKKVKVSDSVLITTVKTFDHYPDEFETDQLVQKLKAYIKVNDAKEMNYPMLHVRQKDSVHFEAMAAIATDIKLPDSREFESKMLLKGGNLLEAEITGGHSTIRKAFEEYEKAITEYSQTSPAIPYQLIITDRTKERDTAKWVTKICYPVF